MEQQLSKDLNQSINKEVKKGVGAVSWIAAIFAVVGIITLIIIKVNMPSFPWWQTIIIGVIFILICIGVAFTFYMLEKNKDKTENLKEESKLPKPCSLAEARKMAIDSIKDPIYADYISDNLGEGVNSYGTNIKNSIYWFKAKGTYEDVTYLVLINMNYPNTHKTIIINPKDNDIHRYSNMLTMQPEPEPHYKTIVTSSPFTGVQSVSKEPVTESKIEEEKKKEDVLE